MFDADWDRTFNTMDNPACRSIGTTQPPKPRRVTMRTLEERLKELHRKRCAAHPDRGGSNEEFIRLNREYVTLKRKVDTLRVSA